MSNDPPSNANAPSPASQPNPERRTAGDPYPLHVKILFGLIVGTCLGLAANYWLSGPGAAGSDEDGNGIHDMLDLAVNIADPVGRIFLRLVLMVVVPLVFSALTLGVYEIGDVRRLGRVGLRTLLLTVVLSTAAVTIGLVLVNTIQPGNRLAPEKREALRQQYSGQSTEAVEKAKKAKPLKDTLLDIIPENPLQEMVGAVDGSSKGNGMLSVMFFSLVFGIALTTIGERGNTLVLCLQGVFEVTMKIIAFAMKLAPYAVACLLFAITSRLGLSILQTLFWFVLTVMLGLSLHMFVVYSIALRTVGRKSPLAFFREINEATLTAFGTSSSNATLPTALRVAEENLKLPRNISTFVLTVGSTANQNGTGLYEGVVVLFLAQVFGIELTLIQQITVVLMSVLAGIGTAGVPGGSLPLIVIVMQTVGVPAEGIGLILGIDRVLDMCRTVLNVAGDLTIAQCVSSWEARSAPILPETVPEAT